MRLVRAAGTALVTTLALTGCTDDGGSMPGCDADSRLALIAQSVPGAAYIPCIDELPTGWSFESVTSTHDGTTITLESDRADRPIEIALAAECDIGSATPIVPSDAGTRTYHLIESIDPRYAGRFIDVFAGGCVVSRYDFERGPHVGLITELQSALGLYPRRQLGQELRSDLGITLDP